MSLAELQQRFRDALVTGDAGRVASLLVGGLDPRARLAIHQRHYEASLVRALLDRFRATQWLVGSEPVIEAARDYVRSRPPNAPCIAEFGEGFAAHLAATPMGRRIPYLREFADCDWHLGRVAISVDQAPAGADARAALREIPAAAVASARLVLQVGVHYLQAAWPIDTLMALFAGEQTPDHVVVEPATVYLEVRGSRGACWITRLEAGDFAFREALHAGLRLAEAADRGWAVCDTFDPGRALTALWAAGLVTAVVPASLEEVS
ncbi:MAG: DNA-binding domain-containing protein [Acidobacteriota bacterium]